jgi:hypothetical protein
VVLAAVEAVTEPDAEGRTHRGDADGTAEAATGDMVHVILPLVVRRRRSSLDAVGA